MREFTNCEIVLSTQNYICYAVCISNYAYAIIKYAICLQNPETQFFLSQLSLRYATNPVSIKRVHATWCLCDSLKAPAEEVPPSVEELALMAFARMKEHLTEKAVVVHAHEEVEDTAVEMEQVGKIESERTPDLLLLDSKATSRRTEKGETAKR